MIALAALMVLSMQQADTQVAAAQPTEIKEWKVPWPDTRPRDPFVGRDGRVWFVGQEGHYIAALDTVSGQFKRYDLDPGTGPHNLIVDDSGTVFYSGNLTGHIGRLDPGTGKVTKYPMPDPAARDPHTLIFDNNYEQNRLIWFTVQGGNFVGRFNTRTGEVTLRKSPTPNSRPY